MSLTTMEFAFIFGNRYIVILESYEAPATAVESLQVSQGGEATSAHVIESKRPLSYSRFSSRTDI